MGGWSESSPPQGWDFRGRPLSPVLFPTAGREGGCHLPHAAAAEGKLSPGLILHVCLRVTRVSDLFCAEFSLPAYFVAFSSVD